MTIKQYLSTFLYGLADYLKDVRRDMLVRDLAAVDPSAIDSKFAYPWKEGGLRHYVRQRRLALRYNAKRVRGQLRWHNPKVSLPKDGTICFVRPRQSVKEMVLLKYYDATKTFASWHDGKNQYVLSVPEVESWAYSIIAGEE